MVVWSLIAVAASIVSWLNSSSRVGVLQIVAPQTGLRLEAHVIAEKSFRSDSWLNTNAGSHNPGCTFIRQLSKCRLKLLIPASGVYTPLKRTIVKP